MSAAPAVDTPPVVPATRPRVWAAPLVRSHGLVVLAADRLVLAGPGGPPLPQLRAAAETGADLDGLLGPQDMCVELADVRRASFDLAGNAMTLDCGPSRVTVVFADADAADSCFTRLWRLLGKDCSLVPYRRDPWALAAAPLGLLAAVLILTAVLAGAVNTFDEYSADRPAGSLSIPAAGPLGRPDDGSVSAMERLLGWMDWRVVCGLGGAAAAATQVWLVRRVTAPPAALELVRG
jgi:hypothetical protein